MGTEADGRAQELTRAFEAFNQVSGQLQSSYRELERRVATLSEELTAARHDRTRQRAEKERLAERLERLLETLPGGVVVTGSDGEICDANPVARELLGEPLVGRDWHAVATRAFTPATHSTADLSLRDGRRVSLSRRALSAEPGQIILLTDVTEARAIHDLLERHKRLSAMGEMAAALAHQIRTPLAAALLYASQLAHAGLEQSERHKFAHKTVARLHQLERMIDDMLLFARGGRGGMETIGLDSLFEELERTLEPHLTAGACLLFTVASARLAVCGNREALLGALMNLATNALQASGEDACLEVSARPTQEGGVEVRVRDNGPGIPERVQERIFEPFFTTRANGTGLGLAVVQAVVAAHDGRIAVDSAEGGGTTFVVHLPAAQAVQALPSGARTGHSGPADDRPDPLPAPEVA